MANMPVCGSCDPKYQQSPQNCFVFVHRLQAFFSQIQLKVFGRLNITTCNAILKGLIRKEPLACIKQVALSFIGS
jgi:hypothetical protein